MLELGVLKEKGNLKYWLIGLVYLLIIVTFFLILLPQMQEASRLRKEIDEELELHKFLTTVINRKEDVIDTLQENEGLVKDYEYQIPRSYDLPVVLLSIHQLADLAGLELTELKYSLMRKDSSSYWYPLSLEIAGKYTAIYQFLQALNAYLPSAEVSDIQLTSKSDKQMLLSCDISLYIVPEDFETEYPWKMPTWDLTDEFVRNGFGLPLIELEEFYNGGLKLLGTISRSDGRNRRALVSFQGEEHWKTVGSYVGIGRIISIQPQSIIVDVNGFKTTISMGG